MKLLKRIVATVVVIAWAGSANATLIDNGGTTTDTDTGLKWLDLTSTIGFSVDAFLADTGGFQSAGWSVALGSQVDTLFVNAGAAGPGTDRARFPVRTYRRPPRRRTGCIHRNQSPRCSESAGNPP